jgi:putative ABC transport system permease protein
VRAINIKLLREVWGMRGQALAIILVITSGVGIFIMSLSTLDSLTLTREHYYRQNRFADVFASLKRAPNPLQRRIAQIAGVDRVETRVVAVVSVQVAGFNDPITGKLISLPDEGEPPLNKPYLRRGRWIDPGRDDEVILSESFAKAHQLAPGDTIRAIINGKRKALTIVGIALSPEYIYQIAPGAIMPDFKRYAIMWMARTPLSTAYDMDGAFNDVSLTLSSGTRLQDVLDRLDQILAPYGGRGAYGRADQLSHQFLTEELKQLETTATAFPVIFFGVAAFLLNIVMSRLISLQREVIAGLKAFGYSNLDVGVHYAKLVLIIVSLGVIAGLVLGIYLGEGLSGIYTEYYRFPYLHYILKPWIIVAATAISFALALLGTLRSLYRAAKLPPAQAMRPEPPAIYHATMVERLGMQRFFSQPTRMILRHIERRPFKSLLSMVGIASAVGIMMVGNFQEDAIDYMVNIQFRLSQHEDISVSFTEPTSYNALYSLRALPGVHHVEGVRSVPVRLQHEQLSYRTSINGLDPGARLQQVLNERLQPIKLPEDGVVLTDFLAKKLGVGVGDILSVEVLEGNRRTRSLMVTGITKQYLGMLAYMQRHALNRFMQEGNAISQAQLAVDPRRLPQIFSELNNMPRVVGTIIHKQTIKNFYELVAEAMLFFTFVATLLGGIIAFGVVYNTARIALAERGRELASLRILGFTRAEVAYILLGELALLTVAAIPLGFVIGAGLCEYLVVNLQTELYRVPLVLEHSTYAFAALVVILSSAVSGALIWHNLTKLDLIGVLKTKE